MDIYREIKEKLDDVCYLCDECARRNGGKWPKGHAATMHIGKCDICKNERSLANVGDWDWPDGKARGMRD